MMNNNLTKIKAKLDAVTMQAAHNAEMFATECSKAEQALKALDPELDRAVNAGDVKTINDIRRKQSDLQETIKFYNDKYEALASDPLMPTADAKTAEAELVAIMDSKRSECLAKAEKLLAEISTLYKAYAAEIAECEGVYKFLETAVERKYANSTYYYDQRNLLNALADINKIYESKKYTSVI